MPNATLRPFAALLLLGLLAGCGRAPAPPALSGEPLETTTSTIDEGVEEVPEAEPPPTSAPAAGLLETIDATGNLQTLAGAIDTAGLADTLAQPGPYTVFAPDDRAFTGLPGGTLDQLLAQPEALRQLLGYHVVPGALSSAELAALPPGQNQLPTLTGPPVTVQSVGDALEVGGARITQADIEATNGVIHIIDAVLQPPAA